MSDNPAPATEVPNQSVVAPPSEPTTPVALSGGGGLLAVIERLATNKDANLEVFARLMDERRREEDRAAERAFNSAMSAAKGELSPVLKTRAVDFVGKTGTRTKYSYEEFADVARTVDPVFARHGLSYRFSVAQKADLVTVTCIVSHDAGHSERMPLEGKVDPGSTGMSTVQALGSCLTYLQRYSLRAAIGLAAGRDDDGRGAGGTSPKISVAQANELEQLIQETGSSQPTLLRLYGAATVVDLTVDQYTAAKEVLGVRKAEMRRKNAPAGN